MTDDIKFIKRMCILNFMEMQEIKKRLDIADQNPGDLYDFHNSTRDYLKALDSRMTGLLRDFPYLGPEN